MPLQFYLMHTQENVWSSRERFLLKKMNYPGCNIAVSKGAVAHHHLPHQHKNLTQVMLKTKSHQSAVGGSHLQLVCMSSCLQHRVGVGNMNHLGKVSSHLDSHTNR